MFKGNILKMRSTLHEDRVDYFLPIGKESLFMNDVVGKKIKLEFEGQINCIDSGEKISKTYNQGYSYKSFKKLASCDLCYVKPELCHFEEGTCREPEWAKEVCFSDHIIYLSLTSDVKVGITRSTQIPTRWVDQGAEKALAILRVPDRHTAGLIESELKKDFKDITNWRKMLKGEYEDIDLISLRESLFDDYAYILDAFGAEDLDEEVVRINFPLNEAPPVIKSLSFDKQPIIESKLIGIKGQYLILEDGVLNMRKHQGYFLKVSTS